MGLDMYLNKETYIGNKWKKPKEQAKIIIPKRQDKTSLPIKGIQTKRIQTLTEEIGYWRKANAIHLWFVNNIQSGNDDCGTYDISREKIEELLKICQKVKNDPTQASTLLPTTSGFFFGSTSYDKYYFEDIENTIEMLEEALKEEGGDFTYHSSW